MRLADFNQLLRDRNKNGTLHDSDGFLKRDIAEEFIKDEENLKNEFFEGIEHDLAQNNISNLSYYLGLLVVNPFTEKDNERFQKLAIRSIEKLENINDSPFISKLANFIWILLDHMLHNWTMSDDKLMISRLKKFKISLKKFEMGYKGEVELLYQKLEHFGVE
jgi:hypothetical protein